MKKQKGECSRREQESREECRQRLFQTPERAPVGMLVNEVAKLFHNRMRSACEKIGIPNGYRPLLMCLVHEDGVPQQSLAERTHQKASTISVTIHKMEEEGLVLRQSDDQDQRQMRVYLTEEGRKLDQKIQEQLHLIEERIMDGFSEEESRTLKQYLDRVRRSLLV